MNDLDYLSARLHGRKSCLAEGERLDALCAERDISEMGRAVHLGVEIVAVTEIQRRLMENLAGELWEIAESLNESDGNLFRWMAARFQVENIKVLLRASLRGVPWQRIEPYLLALPKELTLNAQALAAAKSLGEFARLLPRGELRQGLIKGLEVYARESRPFFFEAVMDGAYFEELVSRAGRLAAEDRELIEPIVLQEANAFLLMLALRGRFLYGMPPEKLMPLYIKQNGILRWRFAAMLTATDVRAAIQLALGPAIDVLPIEQGSSEIGVEDLVPAVEALTWRRYLRLCARAFRSSHMGLGAVMGYVGIRRVEVANLVTVSEGIRNGMAAEEIRPRMVSRTESGVAHV